MKSTGYFPINLIPITGEVGESRQFTIRTSLDEVKDRVGLPNATEFDDPGKVPASWAYKDKRSKKRVFIWAYKVTKKELPKLKEFSADGDYELLCRLFPGKVTRC